MVGFDSFLNDDLSAEQMQFLNQVEMQGSQSSTVLGESKLSNSYGGKSSRFLAKPAFGKSSGFMKSPLLFQSSQRKDAPPANRPTTPSPNRPTPSTDTPTSTNTPYTQELPSLRKGWATLPAKTLPPKRLLQNKRLPLPQKAIQRESLEPLSVRTGKNINIPRQLLGKANIPLLKQETSTVARYPQKPLPLPVRSLPTVNKPSLPLKTNPVIAKKVLSQSFFDEFDDGMDEILGSLPETTLANLPPAKSPPNPLHKQETKINLDVPASNPTDGHFAPLPVSISLQQLPLRNSLTPNNDSKILASQKHESTPPTNKGTVRAEGERNNISPKPLPLKTLPLQTPIPAIQKFSYLLENKIPEQVEIALLDHERFEVSYTTNSCLREAYNQIPGSVCIESEKQIHFPLNQYLHLIGLLKRIPKVTVHYLPQRIVDIFVHKRFRTTTATLDAIPPSLLSQLLPYQKDGIKFALERQGRVMICDDMGLGKSVQAIGVVSCYKNEWPLLVICPASLRQNWASQFTKWLPDVRDCDVNIIYNGKKARFDSPINIVSYDLAANLHAKVQQSRFKVVIVDESHSLKDSRTKRTKNITPIIKNAKRAILLSGTPAVSRPVELFSQLEVIAPRLFPKFIDFATRYCDGHPGQYGFECNGASNLNELHLLLSQTVMIRRLKSDVLNQLPPKTRVQIPVHITDGKHSSMLKKAFMDLGRFRAQKYSKNKKKAKNAQSEVLTIIMDLFKSTGTCKIPAVMEYLEDQLHNNDEKILVFAYHKDMIQACCCLLETQDISYIKIDGSTNQKKRQGLVDEFQEKEDCRVAVLSIIAAGTGLTLTAATKIIFAELFWNPGAILQAEDRAHRIGQKNAIQVEYLIGRETLDEHIWEILESKLDVLGQTLNGEEGCQMGADLHDEEISPAKFDPANNMYGSFIQRLLDSADNYEERMKNIRERRAEREKHRENLEFLQEPVTAPNKIIVNMDDEYYSSQSEAQLYGQSLEKEERQIGEKRSTPEAIASQSFQNSAAKLKYFSYQPPKKKKKFVD